MNQKKWTSKEKLRIVLEGIKGQVPLGNFASETALAKLNITSGVTDY